MLSSGKLTPSTIPHLHLNGAQSLQPFTAYGLQALCLRLTPTVTGTRSRLDNRYGGSPLPVLYFQLPANKCLVAHQLSVQINSNDTELGRYGAWLFRSPSAVPEPGTLGLLGFGLFAIIVMRRERFDRRPIR